MPRSCEADAFYLGSVIVTRVYVGDHNQVWPCYNCLPDLELLNPQYDDALMYVVKACEVVAGSHPPRLTEHFSEVELTEGTAYNGVADIDPLVDSATWRFLPPDTGEIGGIIVEAELDAITDIVGKQTSGICFYLTMTTDISEADEGVLLVIEGITIELLNSLGGTLLKATAEREAPLDPLSVTVVSTYVPLTGETRVIVDYQKDETDGDILTVYFNNELVEQVHDV